jgi:hypothetical protein
MDSHEEDRRELSETGVGLMFGMIFGTALGVVFGVALNNMGFMAIGIGAGMCIGLAIGASLEQRRKEGGG